jgi:2-amino-4-hydroxy-6-hydroxymethyldihydropteridine diphosphokinase
MTKAVLSIGSNLGERFDHLQTVVHKITQNEKISNVFTSSIYETKPVGGPEQGNFLNAVLVIETELSALELLQFAQQLEDEAGRIRDIRWGPRTLDVDILVFGDEISNDEVLTLPHPRISERAFVIVPWLEIEPNAVIPGSAALSELEKSISKSDVQLNSDMKLQVNL